MEDVKNENLETTENEEDIFGGTFHEHDSLTENNISSNKSVAKSNNQMSENDNKK